MTYLDLSGNVVTLGPKVGGGGEAEIFEVRGQPGKVAKIYKHHSHERLAKLTAMVKRPPTDPTLQVGHVSICWPADILSASKGSAAGFLMARMDLTHHREVFKLYNPRSRKTEAPEFTWKNLVIAAGNIANVVQSIHSQGYVIGDINESNFFVSTQTYVTLVDCDSVQVTSAGRTYRCVVGKPEFTPPELQGKPFASVDRTPAQDNFGLAVLLFQLLMEGVHPFMGIWKRAGDPTLEEKIKLGACTYAGSRDIDPMPSALPFTFLPDRLRTLFVRAFKEGHSSPGMRPSPQEWMAALHAGGQALTACANNRKHFYPSTSPRCTWCERKRLLGGVDPFPLVAPPPRPAQRPMPAQQFAKSTPFPPTPSPFGNLPAPFPKIGSSPRPTFFSTAAMLARAFGQLVKICLIVAGLAFGWWVLHSLLASGPDKAPAKVTLPPSPAPSPTPDVQEPEDAWPIDSPYVTAASSFPALGLFVRDLVFFSGPYSMPPLQNRSFQTSFSETPESALYWQLNFETSGTSPQANVLTTTYLYSANNTLYYKSQSRYTLPPGSGSFLIAGALEERPGTLPPGEYHASVFINQQKAAIGGFIVQAAPPPPQQADIPPQPAGEQGQQPVTQPANPIGQPDAQQPPPYAPPPQAPAGVLDRYRAKHEEFGRDCAGVLTLRVDGLDFSCLTSNSPGQSFSIDRRQVKANHKNGVELFDKDKKFHFDITGMDKKSVEKRFADWFAGR